MQTHGHQSITQSTTGKKFTIHFAPASNWEGEWPTGRVGDVLVSEMPGNCDGSVFAYWVGAGKSLNSPGVLQAIQEHIDDHDVVGVHIICALPARVHPSLREDVEQLTHDAQSATLREGDRVRVKHLSTSHHDRPYGGRAGTVRLVEYEMNQYCFVYLESQPGHQAEKRLFKIADLMALPPSATSSDHPPMSSIEFLGQMSRTGHVTFAGAAYTLREQEHPGEQKGWAVLVSYPDGTNHSFGERHCLPKSLAIKLATSDAFDWFFERRNKPQPK